MDKKDYGRQEQEYGGQWRALGAFFDPDNRKLDPDEERGLNPILEGLRQDAAHYSEPVLISEGGEKQIFKIRDLRTDRIVAMAKPLAKATDQDKEQFLREARLTACLQHPNIMTIYDQGLDEDGVPYFTMEFVHGDTLKEIVEKLAAGDPDYTERYPRERLLEIFVKVCDALSYAHSRGVVHLDVKPANIQVGPFGEVHLCDWGLSRILSKGFDEEPERDELADDRPNSDLLNDLTPTGFVKGTPGFLAPEQVGDVVNVSEQTDVYALGAVLCYMLTYLPPVQGESAQEIMQKTVNGEIVSTGRAVHGHSIPRGLEAVVIKALALDQKDRYPSAQKLREELDRFLLGFATEAQQAGMVEQAGLLLKRRPVISRVIGVSTVLLILIGAISFVRIVQEKRQAEENLRLYKAETARSRMLLDNIRTAAGGMQNRENYLDAAGKTRLLALQLKEEANPDEQALIAYNLAMLHFVRQNFQQAVGRFQQSEVLPEHDLFYAMALKYTGSKQLDRDWLSPEELREIILAIPSQYDNVAYSMAFYYFRSRHAGTAAPAQMLQLVETLLDRLNHQGWHAEQTDTLTLELAGEGRALSLSGSPYVIFHLPLPVRKEVTNILGPLKLYSLDISYSDLADPSHLIGSGIRELDIRGITKWMRPQIRLLRQLHLKKLVHSLDETDEFLREIMPETELVRVGVE